MTREEALIKVKRYLTDYFASYSTVEEIMVALEQQPCEDCISRKEVIDIINFEDKWLLDAKSHNANTEIAFSGLKSKVEALQSVTPTIPIGKWITTRTLMHDGEFYCDQCKCDSPNNEKWEYCPNCGADMRGSEE